MVRSCLPNVESYLEDRYLDIIWSVTGAVHFHKSWGHGKSSLHGFQRQVPDNVDATSICSPRVGGLGRVFEAGSTRPAK